MTYTVDIYKGTVRQRLHVHELNWYGLQRGLDKCDIDKVTITAEP